MIDMGKVLPFMCKRGQDDIREATRKAVMARLARTYYGIPNKSKRRPFDRLLGLWPRLPESLKVELRHMMVPAFRKRTSIFKKSQAH